MGGQAQSAGVFLATVEVDRETEVVRGRLAVDCQSPSLAVVELVAVALDCDLLDLDPIQETVNAEALDRVFPQTTDVSDRYVSFSYHGFEVTVDGDGEIELHDDLSTR